MEKGTGKKKKKTVTSDGGGGQRKVKKTGDTRNVGVHNGTENNNGKGKKRTGGNGDEVVISSDPVEPIVRGRGDGIQMCRQGVADVNNHSACVQLTPTVGYFFNPMGAFSMEARVLPTAGIKC